MSSDETSMFFAINSFVPQYEIIFIRALCFCLFILPFFFAQDLLICHYTRIIISICNRMGPRAIKDFSRVFSKFSQNLENVENTSEINP